MPPEESSLRVRRAKGLEQTVETYTLLATLHNPIRADTIDAEKADIHATLTPEVVEVLVADIIRVARTLPRDDEAEDDLITPSSLSDEKEAAPGVADGGAGQTNAGQVAANPLRAEAQGQRVFPQLRKLCDEKGVGVCSGRKTLEPALQSGICLRTNQSPGRRGV